MDTACLCMLEARACVSMHLCCMLVWPQRSFAPSVHPTYVQRIEFETSHQTGTQTRNVHSINAVTTRCTQTGITCSLHPSLTPSPLPSTPLSTRPWATQIYHSVWKKHINNSQQAQHTFQYALLCQLSTNPQKLPPKLHASTSTSVSTSGKLPVLSLSLI